MNNNKRIEIIRWMGISVGQIDIIYPKLLKLRDWGISQYCQLGFCQIR